MNAKGNRVTDIWSSNWTSYQVFKKGTKYSAVIWNPTNTTQFVQFRNAAGNTGSAYVLPRTTLTVDPFVNNGTPTKTSPVPKGDPSPISLPGTVEAENYYTNFSCTSDVASEGGSCLAYIDAGDSALYDVDVAKEGDYTVSYRVNNGGTSTGKIQLKSSLSGSTVLSSTDVPNNNGTWTTVSSTVHLKAGVQRLTLYFATGGFNLNWFSVGSGEVKPTENIALNKTATASSYIGGNTPSLAFDSDNANTRWESNSSDPEWITVDLGSNYNVTGAKLVWETAAGKDYKIQVSNDNTNWVDAYTKTGGNGGTETLTFDTPKTGRYIRMYGTARTTGYGYSLWGFEVYGTQTTNIDTNLALNKTATASSYLGGNTPALAFDNDSANTRWESNYSDPQWITVDLGANYTITGAKLVWETAAGKDYKIQVSTDNTNWVDAYTKTGGTGGTETLTFTNPRTGRYVRMYGTARTTGYGYSLWDFQVYGR